MRNALGPDERRQMGDWVREYFGDDAEKVRAWWSTPNPMLGGIAPASMTILGREDRVYQFIQQAREVSGPNWLTGPA